MGAILGSPYSQPLGFIARAGCWKYVVTSGLTPAFGSRIFCSILSELVQTRLNLGVFMQWLLRPLVGRSWDLEGPRSEHWSGSPGHMTLGRLQITERLYINFKNL